LAKCSATERRRLTESARAYLRTGSISTAAEELFCHRNTLMNRLKRFAELTGVDPTIPEQAAQLVVGWS
jgi:DNA-binding PucR family transcriptional regulator